MSTDPFSDRSPRFTQNSYVDPTPGEKLGRYELVTMLGQGGMGQVWKAEDVTKTPRRLVAIKLLPLPARQNEEAVAMVENVFRIVEGLTHEAICKALDLEHDRKFGPYLVLEYVAGVPLNRHAREYRAAGGKIGVTQVVQWLLPIARGLDYAHSHPVQQADGDATRGVLHRDVKPENILVVRDQQGAWQRSVLIDYGLAAEIRQTVTRYTQATIDTQGTLPYMSPEQIRGKRSLWDPRSDQYALAVVAFELLAGHLPFESDDLGSLREAIKTEAPDPVRGQPEGVNEVLLRGLAKERDGRFGSCVGFLQALERADHAPRLRATTGPVTGSVVAQVPPIAPLAARTGFAVGSQAGDRLVVTHDGVQYAFRWCPAGSFRMGSPKSETGRFDNEDQVEVKLTQGYWMLETEATQRMWLAVMGLSTKEGWIPQYGKGDDYPVYNVTWDDANAFCAKLDEQLRQAKLIPADWKLGLPTEAQWEYACRAGETGRYCFGDDESRLGEYAWYDKNAGGTNHPVGQKKPNNWGLRDMHGSVWEWCADWWSDKLLGGTDPTGPRGGSYRVFRGGSGWGAPADCRSAFRSRDEPAWSFCNLGFRFLAVPK